MVAVARVEISEIAFGQDGRPAGNTPVEVRVRNAGLAVVWDAEVGGNQLPNPLDSTPLGRIEGWVEQGSYDLVILGYTQRFEAVRGDTPPGFDTYQELTDVDWSTFSDGEIPVWNQTTGKWEGGSPYIPKTLADAKADMLGATGADAWARIPGGTEGQVLRRRDAAPTGWAVEDLPAIPSAVQRLYIAGEELRNNAAYGLLGTPDRIAGVNLPDGGWIGVLYHAQWFSSIDGNGRAAIFLGANQAKIPAGNRVAPVTTAAVSRAMAPRVLTSFGGGLAGHQAGAENYTGDVGTGTVMGATGSPTDGSVRPRVELDGTVRELAELVAAGACYIWADPGVYDVSVQFKATAGSVSAKQRRLLVWVV